MNSIDLASLSPKTDVTVALLRIGTPSVWINFAHYPASEMLKEVRSLNSLYCVESFEELEDGNFRARLNPNYDETEIAEAIAQMLENHSLKVRRQIEMISDGAIDSFAMTNQPSREELLRLKYPVGTKGKLNPKEGEFLTHLLSRGWKDYFLVTVELAYISTRDLDCLVLRWGQGHDDWAGVAAEELEVIAPSS